MDTLGQRFLGPYLENDPLCFISFDISSNRPVPLKLHSSSPEIYRICPSLKISQKLNRMSSMRDTMKQNQVYSILHSQHICNHIINYILYYGL